MMLSRGEALGVPAGEFGSWALVTGGFSGIGLEVAKAFLMRGLTVVALDSANPSGLEGEGWARDYIDCERLKMLQVDVNVADFDLIQNAVGVERIRHGIGHLVNCAASFVSVGRGGVRSAWSQVLETNLISPAIFSDWFFETAGAGSTIVNVASISAHIAQPNRWAYNASKAGLVSLTRAMALDFARREIRVNCVSPGWTLTPEVQRAIDSVPRSVSSQWNDFQIVGRLGRAQEIAAAIMFLSSTDSSFITGTELMVDGGYSAIGPEGTGRSSVFAS